MTRVELRRPARRALSSRPRSVVAALVIALLVVALIALGLGDYLLNPLQVVQAAVDPTRGIATTIVLDWRLPRVVTAVAFGAALGVSGALVQSRTKNPLGSPDIIGFSTGSYTGALIVLTVAGSTGAGSAVAGSSVVATSGGALLGGLVTALVVYLLAYRRGMQGIRLIIVGIGVTAVLHAVNAYLLLRASTEVALGASIWGAGSISLVAWPAVWPARVGLVALVPVTMLVSRPLRHLELGDDVARAHGLRVEPARLGILVVGATLMAFVTATSGPIAFVALAAPQIARRLTRSAGVPLIASALVGGFVLLGADALAQHAFATPLPMGLVTVVLGGVYLVILLVREAREAL